MFDKEEECCQRDTGDPVYMGGGRRDLLNQHERPR